MAFAFIILVFRCITKNVGDANVLGDALRCHLVSEMSSMSFEEFAARSVAGGDERVLRCGFPVQPSQGGPQKYRDTTGLRGAQGKIEISVRFEG